jgi:hypothetical protein
MEHSKESCRWHHGPHGWGPGRIVGAVFGGVLIALVFALAFGWLAQILWNWLLPGLFGFKAITYWQAFGVVLLAKLLFGGLGAGHHPPPPPRHFRKMWDWNTPRGPWKFLVDLNWNDDWKVGGSYHNWKYYEQYWKNEGKAAFEEYLRKMNVQNEGK